MLGRGQRLVNAGICREPEHAISTCSGAGIFSGHTLFIVHLQFLLQHKQQFRTPVALQALWETICSAESGALARSRREALSGNFRRHRVVEEPGCPLEPRHADDLRQDLQVPVEVVFDCVPIARSRAQKGSVLER
jgi:hypothetical protein